MQLLVAYYKDGYVTDTSVPSRIGPGHKRHVIIFITKLDPHGCFLFVLIYWCRYTSLRETKAVWLSKPICLVDKHVCVWNVSCFDYDELVDFEDTGKSCRYADRKYHSTNTKVNNRALNKTVLVRKQTIDPCTAFLPARTENIHLYSWKGRLEIGILARL